MPPPPDAAERRFRAAGVPFTLQRRAIWEAFRGRDDHPTADVVYRTVAGDLPGLSRTTVYRTLETFVDLGLACRIGHPGSAARYDPKTSRHHHWICEVCGAVLDVENERLDRIRLPRWPTTGFRVRDFRVEVRGTCARCARAGD